MGYCIAWRAVPVVVEAAGNHLPIVGSALDLDRGRRCGARQGGPRLRGVPDAPRQRRARFIQGTYLNRAGRQQC